MKIKLSSFDITSFEAEFDVDPIKALPFAYESLSFFGLEPSEMPTDADDIKDCIADAIKLWASNALRDRLSSNSFINDSYEGCLTMNGDYGITMTTFECDDITQDSFTVD